MPNFTNTMVVENGKEYGKKKENRKLMICYLGETGRFFFIPFHVFVISVIVQLHCFLKWSLVVNDFEPSLP